MTQNLFYRLCSIDDDVLSKCWMPVPRAYDDKQVPCISQCSCNQHAAAVMADWMGFPALAWTSQSPQVQI